MIFVDKTKLNYRPKISKENIKEIKKEQRLNKIHSYLSNLSRERERSAKKKEIRISKKNCSHLHKMLNQRGEL